MSFIMNRVLTYATILMYITTAGVVYRFYSSQTEVVSISTEYLSIFRSTYVTREEVVLNEVPEIKFSDIKLDIIPKARAINVAKLSFVNKKEIATYKENLKLSNELPFQEKFVTNPVNFIGELNSNFAALFTAIPITKEDTIADSINTKLAASSKQIAKDVEPEFFEYKNEEANKVVHTKPESLKKEEIVENSKAVDNTEKNVNKVDETVDGPKTEMVETKGIMETPAIEEVAMDDLIAYDYSPAKVSEEKKLALTASNTILNTHVVTTQMNSQQKQEAGERAVDKVAANVNNSGPNVERKNQDVNSLIGAASKEKLSLGTAAYMTKLKVKVTGSNLEKTQALSGFELRFQDSEYQNDIKEDYGSGELEIDAKIASPQMTRSATILKRGFAPTTTELIFDGVGEVSLPLIDERTLNDLLSESEKNGPVGALLVELDDETENVEIDRVSNKVIYLDGDMKKTSQKDYRYQLFIGVPAGNTLVSYKTQSNEIVSKIVHIHDHEVTFESNYYDYSENDKFELYEEDLLSKEKAPLIIPGEAVSKFASNEKAAKINDREYKLPFERVLLGARKYIELNHLEEPVFVGFTNSSKLVAPAENLIRYVLSRFENSKLGNRCLVQINLNKKIAGFSVGSESVDSSIMISSQVLDSDGKFYDSASDKSRKVLIVGESQASDEVSKDAKINIKIEYQDGSEQYLNSYCSPNTYLVEQL